MLRKKPEFQISLMVRGCEEVVIDCLIVVDCIVIICQINLSKCCRVSIVWNVADYYYCYCSSLNFVVGDDFGSFQYCSQCQLRMMVGAV